MRLSPRRQILRHVAIYTGLAPFLLVTLFPLVWMISTSLKPIAETMVTPPTFLPHGTWNLLRWDWGNYSDAVQYQRRPRSVAATPSRKAEASCAAGGQVGDAGGDAGGAGSTGRLPPGRRCGRDCYAMSAIRPNPTNRSGPGVDTDG